jgi:predicted ester cyclase
MADMQNASIKTVTDAINGHDAQKYASVFAADGVQKTAGMPDAVGRDAIVASTKQWFAMFPDAKFAFSRVWQKGNLGVSTWDWNATDSGSGFMGAKPTNRPVGLTGATVATYGDDGLIKELHIYQDYATVMQQLDPKAKKNSFRPPPTLATSIDTVAAGSSEVEDGNLGFAKAFYQALDDKKEKDVVGAATEDTAADDYEAPASIKGLKQWKGMYREFATAFPDFKQLPLANQWAIGNYVVSEGVLQGTHKGPIGPFKATGKPVSLHFVDIVQFKAGKIAHLQTWANGVELLTEIGVIKPQN